MITQEIAREPEVYRPDYAPIPRDEEMALVADLTGGNEEFVEAERYCLTTIDGKSRFANLARSLECKVFNEYFGNDPELMAEEYGPYEEASTFFVVIDKTNTTVAGVMRIIGPNPGDLKSVNDVADRGLTELSAPEVYRAFEADPEKTLDVATIAVDSLYGERALGWPLIRAALMRAVYQYCLDNGYDHLMAIIDAKPLQLLRDTGLPIYTREAVPSPFEYLGAAENSFVHIPIPEVEDSVTQRAGREMFDLVFGDGNLGGACRLSFSRQ